jgi:hypothetical protein
MQTAPTAVLAFTERIDTSKPDYMQVSVKRNCIEDSFDYS